MENPSPVKYRSYIYKGTSLKRPPLGVVLNERWSLVRDQINMYKYCSKNHASMRGELQCSTLISLDWILWEEEEMGRLHGIEDPLF